MILLLKLVLFCLSVFGWCLLATHRFHLRMELAPFVVLSITGALLYPAGLLNIYAPAEWVLWLGGLGLLLFFAIRRRESFHPWWTGRTLILAAGGGWMLWLMRGAILMGHDNMSHWGIMVKTMVRFGRLPNVQNQAVEFVGYPPGTSGLIKYFCDFVGTSDGMMMFAQGLLLLTGVFALTVFCPKGQKRGWALWAAAAVFLLIGDITPADLRVDTLLAVQAVGALAVIAYYGADKPRMAVWASMGCLVLLATTKNSGLFFVALDLMVLSWFLLREKSLRRQHGMLVLASWAAPLVSFWLWLRHVALVFPEAANSKHAVTLSGYESIFGGKSAQDMHTFNEMFVHHLVDFSQADTRTMYLVLLLIVLGAVWLWRSGALSGKQTVLLGGALAAGEVLYLACLWGTYAFSMNTNEMLCLASISRYHLTGIIYLGGALAIALLAALAGRPAGKNAAIAGAVFAAAFALMILLDQPAQLSALVSRTPYRDDSTQGEMIQLKRELGLQEGKRYLFYTRGNPEVDTWSMRFVARYVLNTDTVDFWQFPEQEFGYEDLFGHYDYLVLYAPDQDSRDFLQEGSYDPNAPVLELIQ